MKTYRLQKKHDNLWHDYPSNDDVITSQSIKYMWGYQDALADEHPELATRIVWLASPSRIETVRMVARHGS